MRARAIACLMFTLGLGLACGEMRQERLREPVTEAAADAGTEAGDASTEVHDAGQCVGAGASCGPEAQCCAGTYCERNAYVESWQTCVPALPDGEYCWDVADCQSGICEENICGGPACVLEG